MAERPKGFGMTAELNDKLAAKYNMDEEKEAREWIKYFVPEMPDGSGPDNLHEILKDGVYLCNLANAVVGTKIKINSSKMAFKQMENIGNFLGAAENYGVPKSDLFQTVDLYEKTNMGQVVGGIHAFGRKARSNGLHGIGPKESDQNKRSFSEEQLRAGQNVIDLQMGSNKGASQSGMSFGVIRQNLD